MMNQSARELTIYYCGHEQCAPGHFFGPAVRKHYLLHVVLKGNGIYRTSGREYRIAQGEAFLIKPQEITYYQADNTEPWEYAWVAFSGTEADRLVFEYRSDEEGYFFRFEGGNQWREIILALVNGFGGTTHNKDEMRGYLYLLFSRFPGNAPQSAYYEKSYLEQAETYIRHNYSYPIQIADVAGFIGIDRTYLYRIFMRHKGVSPKHYLTEYRVLEAKRLLEETSLSITETALSCGFHDSSVFCRCFQKTEGESPLRYRKGIREINSKM
ncbi:AraC family transcriptional regulator [Lacrimispora sp.]|uniref:AraC family transcriptional regulator n=1 Tax=Lacrimispora sp. TaxID=2719234 RepID=UPI003216BE69